MNETPKKPAAQSPMRQRQIREAAALRANLLKRKDQSRLREAAKESGEVSEATVVKDSA